MIKKLQRKFVLIATGSLLAVLLPGPGGGQCPSTSAKSTGRRTAYCSSLRRTAESFPNRSRAGLTSRTKAPGSR